jgi:hypothetical protein
VLDPHPQRRQVDLHGVSHMLRGCVLIVVAVDVSRAGHVLPGNRRVPRLQVFRQPAIDHARVGCESLVVEAGCELDGKSDVMRNVAQRGGRRKSGSTLTDGTHSSRHTGESRCPFQRWVPACAGKTWMMAACCPDVCR